MCFQWTPRRPSTAPSEGATASNRLVPPRSSTTPASGASPNAPAIRSAVSRTPQSSSHARPAHRRFSSTPSIAVRSTTRRGPSESTVRQCVYLLKVSFRFVYYVASKPFPRSFGYQFFFFCFFFLLRNKSHIYMKEYTICR